jgi:hypothetical protein
MLFFALSEVGSQTIALHPLKGNSPDIAKVLFAEIEKTLDEFPLFSIYLINLEDDETIDVNTGGLPAYMCPQITLTNGSPYAITGEVTSISGFEGMYEVRLYLWEMEFQGLLISDELIIYEGETEAIYLSQLLAWMLSWIDRVKIYTPKEEVYVYVEKEIIIEPEKEIVYVDREIIIEPEIQIQETLVEPQYWLRLGFRLGGGDSMWHYKTSNEYIIHLLNVGIGIQAAVNILPWFTIQPEVNFSVDISLPWNTNPTGGTLVSSYLTIPVLFKFNWYKNNLMTSLFVGPYFYLPLFLIGGSDGNFNYKPQIPGFIFGGSIGWKIGPGHLFVDARFKYDGYFWSNPKSGPFYRNTIKLSIGYELPFFKKKPKEPHVAKNTAVQLPPEALEDEILPVASEEEWVPPPVVEEQE